MEPDIHRVLQEFSRPQDGGRIKASQIDDFQKQLHDAIDHHVHGLGEHVGINLHTIPNECCHQSSPSSASAGKGEATTTLTCAVEKLSRSRQVRYAAFSASLRVRVITQSLGGSS